MGALILFLEPEKIAKLASAFQIMMFIGVNISVIILRETNVQWYNPGKVLYYAITKAVVNVAARVELQNDSTALFLHDSEGYGFGVAVGDARLRG